MDWARSGKMRHFSVDGGEPFPSKKAHKPIFKKMGTKS
jgi:hypothetical protein